MSLIWNYKNKLWKFATAALYFLSLGCSGSPSISVLPSTDSYTQNGNQITAKMDILWVMDTSGSMEPYQEALIENFNAFIKNFVGKNYDFRMAVINTDAWYIENGVRSEGETFSWQDIGYSNALCTNYLSSNYPTYKSQTPTPPDYVFSSAFLDGNIYQGTTGHPLIVSGDSSIDFSLTPDANDSNISDDIESIFGKNIAQGVCGQGGESGLRSLKYALSNGVNDQYNFPRQDAQLAVIVVSDEEDNINGSSPDTARPIADYHTFLTDISSPDHGYSFHSIVVPDTACNESSDTHPDSHIGTRYMALSNLEDAATGKTKGQIVSLCKVFEKVNGKATAFIEGLEGIAQTIIETTVEFKLTDKPDNSNKLVVSIKNPGDTDWTTIAQSTVNGWSYNESANSIIFHGDAIPAQNAQVNIYYDPDGL